MAPGYYSVYLATAFAGSSNTVWPYRVAPAPTITAVSPGSGPAGSSVRVTGTGFTGATSVTFGGTPGLAVAVLSDGVLTVTTPARAAGTLDVSLTTPGGTATAPDAFTLLPPAPILTGVAPLSGPTTGGTAITLRGTALTGATAVTVGGSAAASVTVVNDSTITAVTPAHAAGTVEVGVTTAGGTVTRPNAFTYLTPPPQPVVARVEPDAGPTAGGTAVTIVGSGLTGTTAVTFGGTSATQVTVVDDTAVTAVTPAHDPGAVNVVLSVPGGPATLAGGFTFVPPPTPAITDVAPATGTTLGGTQVTLTGTGLAGATQVTFDGTPGTDLRVLGATTLTVTSPAHAAGAVEVSVTTPGGTSAAAVFTYVQPAPVIAAVSPESGTAGTPLTITGDNLTGTTAVTVGAAPATSVTVVDDQTVTATAPANAPGPSDVAVTAPGGTVTSVGAFTYATPALAAAAPTSGSAAGGTAVTLTGSSLAGVTGVTFGDTAAADVIPVDATTITALAPAHAVGTVDITVTLVGGVTATLPAGFTYLAPPTISGVAPSVGPAAGGQPITISGSGLGGAGTVTLGGQPATGVIASDASIAALTPAGGPGSGDVVVTTPVGVAVAARAYTWVAAPRIDAVQPTVGPTTGGTALTISGANLSGATVAVGGTPVPVVASSTSAVSVTTPPGTGTVAVTVTTVGGSATLEGAFGYVAPAPGPGPSPQPPVPPRPVPVTTTVTVTAKAQGKGRLRITARAAPAFGRTGTLQLEQRRKGRSTWQRVARTPAWPNRGSAAVTFTVRVPRGKDTLRLRLPATARGTAATRTFTVKVR